jgi:hypothetical protein
MDKPSVATLSPPIVFVHLPLRQGGDSKLPAVRQCLAGPTWALPIDVVNQVCDRPAVDIFVLVHAPLDGFRFATVLPHASIVGFPGECLMSASPPLLLRTLLQTLDPHRPWTRLSWLL